MGQHAPARILAIFVAERSGSPRKSAIIYHLHLLSYDCSPWKVGWRRNSNFLHSTSFLIGWTRRSDNIVLHKYWIQKRTECNWGVLVLRWAVFTLQLETHWTFQCLFLHFGAKNFEDWHQDVTGCICLRRNRVKLRRFLQDLWVFESLESCGSKIWIHSIYAGLHEFLPFVDWDFPETKKAWMRLESLFGGPE